MVKQTQAELSSHSLNESIDLSFLLLFYFFFLQIKKSNNDNVQNNKKNLDLTYIKNFFHFFFYCF